MLTTHSRKQMLVFVSPALGQPDYMSQSEINSLLEAGWRVVSVTPTRSSRQRMAGEEVFASVCILLEKD